MNKYNTGTNTNTSRGCSYQCFTEYEARVQKRVALLTCIRDCNQEKFLNHFRQMFKYALVEYSLLSKYALYWHRETQWKQQAAASSSAGMPRVGLLAKCHSDKQGKVAGATNNRGGDFDTHADAPTRPVYLPGMSPLRSDHGLDDAGGVAQAPKCSKVDAGVAQKSKAWLQTHQENMLHVGKARDTQIASGFGHASLPGAEVRC